VGKRKLVLLLGGVAALVLVVGALLWSLGGEGPDGRQQSRAQRPAGTGVGRTPGKAMRLPPARRKGSAAQSPVPAAVREQELDPMEVAEPPPAEVLEKQRAERRVQAQQRQVTLYQEQLLNLERQVDRLRKTVQRMKQEGSASPEQIAQVERRLQQMIEAEPRMRSRLRDLERKAQQGQQQKGREQVDP